MEDDPSFLELKKLREQFCPPLDEAVFLAVQSDYNIRKPQERQALIETLTLLQTSALDQENATFDPSGTSGLVENRGDLVSTGVRSSPGDESTSTSLSDLNWDNFNDFGTSLEVKPLDEKLAWLNNMFPNIKPVEIAQILRNSNCALNKAIDQLLNLSFLHHDIDENGRLSSSIPKGIDGFADDQNQYRPRKSRGKKKLRTADSSRGSSTASFRSDASNERSNIWASLVDDVNFVCARTKLQPQAVKSAYHANSASLPATIRDLAVKEAEHLPLLDDADTVMQIQVVDLKHDFLGVDELQLMGVLSLARNIVSSAHELLAVMVASPGPTPIGKVSSYAQYAPTKLDEEAESVKPSQFSPSTTISLGGIANTATTHGLAATNAFRQASSAYSRGKSDRLMGGVAAYYASVGHEHVKLAKEQNAAAADAHVTAHSSATTLDLHGVSVTNAVRIAKSRIEQWWDGLGDTKYAPGGGGPVRAGYHVVTGVGRHSKDGTPRIGPAVSRMLVREGWKIEVGQGEIMVYGKMRR